MNSARFLAWLVLPLTLASLPARAFDSGSSGVDGELAPLVDVVVDVPADGVLEYTSIDIPAGVTVRFRRNAVNTPVTVLVSGDATVAGTIDLSGETAADSFGAGSGNVADDGLPGGGGPGGFRGGRGGFADPSTAPGTPRIGEAGQGPGGGAPQTMQLTSVFCSPASGAYATAVATNCNTPTANAYGTVEVLPLIGGSGGGGGNGGSGHGGSGGGGGGGAMLLAVSGTLQVAGVIRADGGFGGTVGYDRSSSSGGGTHGAGGSGGAIRLVATTLTGNGTLSALGGRYGGYGNIASTSFSRAGLGRIRLEAETLTRTAPSDPPYTSGLPGPLFVDGPPSLRIASVAGIAAPAEPTGQGDILLPSALPNPVEVVFEAANVPLGTTVEVIVTPPSGLAQTVVSTALAGDLLASSATASVALPDGASTLLATVRFAVSGAQQQQLARFTEGEPVVAVELAAGFDGSSVQVLITASGRRVTL